MVAVQPQRLDPKETICVSSWTNSAFVARNGYLLALIDAQMKTIIWKLEVDA